MATAARVAVSPRRMRGPREKVVKPSAPRVCRSSACRPPSGPRNRPVGTGASAAGRAACRSPSQAARRWTQAPGSSVASGVTGRMRMGSARWHCLQASIMMRCQRSCWWSRSPRFSQWRVSTGARVCTPSSVAFWTTKSIFPPLSRAWTRVRGAPAGAFSRRRSVTSAVTSRMSQPVSTAVTIPPRPSKNSTARPGRKRSTRAMWRASAPVRVMVSPARLPAGRKKRRMAPV